MTMKQSMMLALAASMLASSHAENTQENPRPLTDEERNSLYKKAQQKRIEDLKKGGMKEFDYNGKIILALNQKNADRKAKKLGYI